MRKYQKKLMSRVSRKTVNKRDAQTNFENYMQEKLGHFYVPVEPGPIGDIEIIKRTALQREDDVADRASEDVYFSGGYSTMLHWLQLAEKHGLNLRTVASIFEFGCGSARLIRHLRCIDGIQLVGSDVMGDFIFWCQENIPGVNFYKNELDPPLPFAESNSFDFAFAQSVFTHIPLETQAEWIREMHRILRPSGLFIGTVLGKRHEQIMLSQEQSAELRQQGHLTLDADDDQASYSTQLIKSWDIFQTRSEVLKAFGTHFEVLDYIPHGLDILVLRKIL